MESDSWLIGISIMLLIVCSAFFSASETSVSTFNKIRMKKRAEDGDPRAKSALKLLDDYGRTLSAILIGNNIVNITSSALATILFTFWLGPAKGAAMSTVLITLLVLLFGEIMPKNHAMEHADQTALRFAPMLNIIVRALSPLVFLLTALGRVLRGSKATEQSPSITEEELIYMMDAIEEEGVLEEQERDLVQSALEFDEISLWEILTPRVNIVALDVESEPDEIRQTVIEKGYSRIPVFEKTIDNIIGVLYSRDALLGMLEGGNINLRDMPLGEALFVHKGMKLSHLLTSFKARKLNLAVVVDEYGGTLGIVTMEDVLEELVGDIWDEDDEVPHGLIEISEGKFEAAGDYGLSDMFEHLGIDADDRDIDYSTIGGWALHTLEHIPDIGEKFTFSGYRFTVLEMDGHRLKKLGIEREAEPHA